MDGDIDPQDTSYGGKEKLVIIRIQADLSSAQVVNSVGEREKETTRTHKKANINDRAAMRGMSRSTISALLVFALLSCGYVIQTAASVEPEGFDEAETDVTIETEAEDDDDSVRDGEYLDIASVIA